MCAKCVALSASVHQPMSGTSSTLDSGDEALDRIHQVLDDADSESITDAERRLCLSA